MLAKIARDMWSEFLSKNNEENDTYVAQYDVSSSSVFVNNNGVMNDFFRFVYVSKLPRGAAVEYHVIAVNNKISKVVYSASIVREHENILLRTQAMTCYNSPHNENSVHMIAVHAISKNDTTNIDSDEFVDSVIDSAKAITNEIRDVNHRYSICRLFIKHNELKQSIVRRFEIAVRQRGMILSVIPCDRVALSSTEDNSCLMCCEFESFT